MSYDPPAQPFQDNTNPIGGGRGQPLDPAFFNNLVAGVDDADTRLTAVERPGSTVKPYLYVDDYRQPGDPDDTLAWRRAITAAVTSGVKRVHARNPSYTLSGAIDCKDANGLVVSGAGIDATTLNVSGTTNPVDLVFYTSGATRGITFENFTIAGTVADDVTGPRRSRTYTGPGYNCAFAFRGDLNPNATGRPAVSDIRLRQIRIVGSRSLPFLFDGIRGVSQAFDVETYLTMDGGWIYCEFVSFDSLRSSKSADNGFSVSRGCQRVVGGSVQVDKCAYYGFWLSGFVVNHVTNEAGPQNFQVDTINVTNAGKGIVQLDDGPQNGHIGSIFGNGVARGPSDEPTDLNCVGIRIGSYPSDNRPSPQVYAANLVIDDVMLMNCARGGIAISGATDVMLGKVRIINPGTQYRADGTTAIAASEVGQNFGVACEPGAESTVTRLSVRDLRVIDNRATPYANYPLYYSGSVSPDVSQISAVGCRQLVATNDNTNDSYSGVKIFGGNAKFTAGSTAGANAATGPVPGFDVNGTSGSTRRSGFLTGGVARWYVQANAAAESGSNTGSDLEIVARDDAGALLSTPLSIRRSDGRASWGAPVVSKGYTTATRPSASAMGVGASCFDTTLNKPIWSDGTNWRDAAGTIV